MHRRKALHPDVLEQANDRQLALLIEERVVGENGEVDLQAQEIRMEVMTSPCLMPLTTSMPLVTWPKTVWTPSR